MAALHHAFDFELHVVAQVIEPEFVVGAVGDIGPVGLFALAVVHLVLDAADGQTQKPIDLAHPVGVALRQVVVDGHHVDTATGERVQADRQRRHQGLALAGAHLGDPALVEDDAAHQLDIEVAHADRALAGLPHQCEDLDQFLIEDLLDEGGPFARVLGKFGRSRLGPSP